MSRIRILSEHLANQIAAGEVVERPASVVKELVENSLDAGATRVSVQVEGGGTRLLRVVDNGQGMGEDDVLLSIERHATSKLSDETQLDDIRTLGFRGEALPSIGSVSRLILLSRPQKRETGTRAEIRYGKLHSVHEAGCSTGTIAEVRGLFGNVPARRKFLKSARTEQYHIKEVVRNQSLAHERTAFSLVVDNRTILDLPGVEDVSQRVRGVFQYRGQHLLTIDVITGDDKNLHLRGFLLPPEFSSSRTGRLRILVNGRPIQDRMVRHAVMEGMRGFLMKGQSPAGALFIDLPARQVDVNVHPAKQEVRFRRSGDVHGSLVQATATSIRAYQDRIRSDLFTMPPSFATDDSGGQRPSTVVEPSGFPAPETGQESVFGKMPVSSGHVSPHKGISAEPSAEFHVLPHAAESALDHVPEEGGPVFSGLTIVGQLLQLYLLCERDGQLVVIDQHAAHERILYQQLSSAYHERTIPRQSLLFPVTVEVAHEQAETLEKYGEDIRRLGFIVDHFGEETWVIKSVPALVKNSDPAELLFESLDILRSSAGRKAGGLAAPIDDLLASMACRAAVKAGDSLAPEEMLELLVQMQSSEYFSHCPHGRPVVKVFSRREIEKWFHRV